MKCPACGGKLTRGVCMGLGKLGDKCPNYLQKVETTSKNGEQWTDVLEKQK